MIARTAMLTSLKTASTRSFQSQSLLARCSSKSLTGPLARWPAQFTASRTFTTSPQQPNVQRSPSWVNSLSKRIQPYMRLIRIDNPAGTWLLYLPCTFSITMAAYGSAATVSLADTAWMLALFGAGSPVMRGAGCIINDLWDRDIDRKVERTKIRPLAAGDLTPKAAVGFLAANLSVGLAVLMQLNWYSIALGACSLAFVVTYPLMKRITYWPQAVLGLTFNWGALLGSSAILGATDWSVALPLYVSGICWTLVYDTIYALQDKRDDVAAGVKSTALYFGDHFKSWTTAFATISVASLALAGWMNGQSLVFYIVSVGGAAAHYVWQIATLDTASRKDAFAKFASNRNWGMIVLAGITADLARRKIEQSSQTQTTQHTNTEITRRSESNSNKK